MPNDLNYRHASFVNGGFFAMTIHFAVRYLEIDLCVDNVIHVFVDSFLRDFRPSILAVLRLVLNLQFIILLDVSLLIDNRVTFLEG